jgi:hypothetical protein
MGQTTPLKRSFDNDDGIEWVCCRICGDYLRVISGRHLGKHDTDRETYMEEYHLTPANKRVEWECISTHPRSSPASAWTGTHFIFEIAERDNVSSGSKHNQVRATTLDFRQAGYDERSDFFGSNNFAWGQVLQKLKQVVESESS